MNLIPHAIHKPEGDSVSDGLGIFRSFMVPAGYYAAMIGRTYNERERDWEAHDQADWWKRER